MIRKSLLILGALLLVVSGVAAVSAFEAHIVNVTAHVENALNVSAGSGTAIGGTAAFPEEWLSIPLTVDLSNSFKAQTRVNKVGYLVCAEKKPAPFTGLWMGGAAYASIDASSAYTWFGPTPDTTPPATGFCTGLSGTLTQNQVAPAVNNLADTVNIWLDVPVFAGYYNADTDVCDKPRPNTAPHNPTHPTRTGTVDGVAPAPCQVPSVIIPVPPGVPTGTDLGMDVKIQVTSIGP